MNKITKFDSKTNSKTKKTDKSKANPKSVAQLKAYLGFEYIKLKKDVNGLDFCIKHLREYAKDIRYIISVAREVNSSTFVYNFFVENSKLKNFFTSYLEGKIEGEIIEIDKLNPEILA